MYEEEEEKKSILLLMSWGCFILNSLTKNRNCGPMASH